MQYVNEIHDIFISAASFWSAAYICKADFVHINGMYVSVTIDISVHSYDIYLLKQTKLVSKFIMLLKTESCNIIIYYSILFFIRRKNVNESANYD